MNDPFKQRELFEDQAKQKAAGDEEANDMDFAKVQDVVIKVILVVCSSTPLKYVISIESPGLY